MGYRSDVALALTAKGVSEMKTAMANLDPETNMLVTDFIKYADQHAFDPASKAEAYLWDSVKWHDGYQDINFFERFMRDLEAENYRFIRIGDDYDDTEVEGYFYDNPFDIELARDITFDNRYAVQV